MRRAKRRPIRNRLLWLAPWIVVAMIAPAVQAASASVAITDAGYDPIATTVSTGDAVTWQNGGTRPHTVTADDGSFDSGPLDPGNQFANVFNTPGTFQYHSSSDASFRGTVIVKAASPTPTPATFVPTPPPGTLPPNFSPHPILTAPDVTTVPTPTGEPSAGGGSVNPALALIILAMLAVVGAIAFVRARERRARSVGRRRR